MMSCPPHARILAGLLLLTMAATAAKADRADRLQDSHDRLAELAGEGEFFAPFNDVLLERFRDAGIETDTIAYQGGACRSTFARPFPIERLSVRHDIDWSQVIRIEKTRRGERFSVTLTIPGDGDLEIPEALRRDGIQYGEVLQFVGLVFSTEARRDDAFDAMTRLVETCAA